MDGKVDREKKKRGRSSKDTGGDGCHEGSNETIEGSHRTQPVVEKECKDHRSPSPKEEPEIEEGGTDPETTSTQLKHECPREKVRS